MRCKHSFNFMKIEHKFIYNKNWKKDTLKLKKDFFKTNENIKKFDKILLEHQKYGTWWCEVHSKIFDICKKLYQRRYIVEIIDDFMERFNIVYFRKKKYSNVASFICDKCGIIKEQEAKEVLEK